jgi:hypothetical protein
MKWLAVMDVTSGIPTRCGRIIAAREFYAAMTGPVWAFAAPDSDGRLISRVPTRPA